MYEITYDLMTRNEIGAYEITQRVSNIESLDEAYKIYYHIMYEETDLYCMVMRNIELRPYYTVDYMEYKDILEFREEMHYFKKLILELEEL